MENCIFGSSSRASAWSCNYPVQFLVTICGIFTLVIAFSMLHCWWCHATDLKVKQCKLPHGWYSVLNCAMLCWILLWVKVQQWFSCLSFTVVSVMLHCNWGRDVFPAFFFAPSVKDASKKTIYNEAQNKLAQNCRKRYSTQNVYHNKKGVAVNVVTSVYTAKQRFHK